MRLCRPSGRLPWEGLLLGAVLLATPAARAIPCDQVELPVLLLVEDRSTSMTGTVNYGACITACGTDPAANPTCWGSTPACEYKWDIVEAVIPDVINSFAGAFRFGLQMFPDPANLTDTACGVVSGQVSLPLGTTPTEIQSAFQAFAPPGGRATPTAAALLTSRDYLNAVNPSSNTYVLLVTDGVPNCNPDLDQTNATTCRCTLSSASACTTRPTGDRCLDDQATWDSASALRAAGYKVYVVGFGSDVSADNNAQVLNGIASHGGTGTAYSARDSATLQTALNDIIGSVQECCQDACSLNAATCTPSGTSRTVCRTNAEGCTAWVTETCSSGSTCSNGSCQACNSTCTAGAKQCDANGKVQTCVADARGCTSWQTSSCAAGSVCSGGTCSSCSNACTAGAKQCSGNGVRSCVADARGCTSWGSVTPCASGTLCNVSLNQCQSCATECAQGALDCTDDTTRKECQADANGCTHWSSYVCDNGQRCAGGTCGACQMCTAGERRCAGPDVQTCETDSQGCTAWSKGTTCATPQFCANGGCMNCPATCELGATDCQAERVRTCTRDANGCPYWQTLTQCEEGQQCINGGCCNNTCLAGEVRCGDPSTVQTCGIADTGCTAWREPVSCDEGQGCVGGTCRPECVFTGEGDDCPAGLECVQDANGAHCVPSPDAGVVTGSSSSGGAHTSSSRNPNAGSGTGVSSTYGDGSGEDDVKDKNCGCEAADGSTLPGTVFLLGLLALVPLRRRR